MAGATQDEIQAVHPGFSDDAQDVFGEMNSTKDDVLDMQRMGRKQVLMRHFRLFSTISFVGLATANWEGTVLTVNQGLINGGRAGLVYSYLWNFLGFLTIILSMAEMASMAPTAGSQYHWVSEFAPSRVQKPLSYFTGWTSILAWQAGNAAGFFLAATLIQTIIALNIPTYDQPPWQATILVIVLTAIVLVCNVYGARYLPYIQNFLFALHCMLYFCLIIPVWVLSPRTDAKTVFTDFSNLGKWPNMGLALLVGQLSGIAGMLGTDTAAHMSEEIKDAARNVPIAMLWAYIINFVLAIPIIITLCFAIYDLGAALDDRSGYAVIYVLRNTMSTGWITALLSAIVLILICSNVNYMAATARDMFAFGRDNGLPLSRWVAKVHPKQLVPTNALLANAIISILLSMIYLGSPIAFYAIVSTFVVAILQCYMFSIGSVLWRRIYLPGTLPLARWSLGEYGTLVNASAFGYSLWAFFWSFWPQTYHVNTHSFNWSVVIFVGTIILSALYYIVKARHVYVGPVLLTSGRESSQDPRSSSSIKHEK